MYTYICINECALPAVEFCTKSRGTMFYRFWHLDDEIHRILISAIRL
jgi:hypothetical protein